MNAPDSDLALVFATASPELRLWMLIVGAGLNSGAITWDDVHAACVSPDPLERCKALQQSLTAQQTGLIRAEFAKMPMPVFGPEGHA